MRDERSIIDQWWFVPCLVLVLAFAFQGSRGIWMPDEGYYSVVATWMLKRGDFIVPHLAYQVWPEKPPLSLWGIAAGLRFLGHGEWGARLFHGLCYVVTVMIVWSFGRMLYGGRVGRWAAFFQATMLLPFVAGNVLTPDGPLALWTTASMFAFWKVVERLSANRPTALWMTVMGTTLGLGFLTKGPAALVPTGAMLAFLVFDRKLVAFFSPRRFWPAALAFATTGLWWYVVLFDRVPDALAYVWDNQVMGRLITTKYRRNPGLLGALEVYGGVMLFGTLPAILVAAGALAERRSSWRRLLSRIVWRAHRREAFLVAWLAVPLVVLSMASSKLPLYALPVFPALALLTAWLVREQRRPWPLTSNRAVLLIVLFLLAIKATSGVVPVKKDMRAPAERIAAAIDAPAYEIVCVEVRCEGLSFYLDQPVERVSLSPHPYPVFRGTEAFSEELEELDRTTYGHLFVYGPNDRARVEAALDRPGGACRRAPIELPFGRRAIFCPPPDGSFQTPPYEPHQQDDPQALGAISDAVTEAAPLQEDRR